MSAPAAASCEAPACDPLVVLPRPLALLVLSFLPADHKLRCAAVCRGWRDALAERSVWRELELSPACGLTRPACDWLLREAAARAGNELRVIRLRDCPEVTTRPLLAVVGASAATLDELEVRGMFDGRQSTVLTFPFVQQLLAAAPRLRALHVDVSCFNAEHASLLLRGEGVFAPVRMRRVHVNLRSVDNSGVSEACVRALAADVAEHAWLRALWLVSVPMHAPAFMDAVVDAALTRKLHELSLSYCAVSPATVPALARLLDGGALAALSVLNDSRQLLDEASAAVLGLALRRSSTLTSLRLQGCGLHAAAAATCVLLRALTAHPSLDTLKLCDERADTAAEAAAAVGEALGALVAADAAALTALDLSSYELGDAGLGPLVDALPANTHLRALHVSPSGCSDTFVVDALLPAVRSNASLCTLSTGAWQVAAGARRDAFAEAECAVHARRAADDDGAARRQEPLPV
jgi:hypothetical protein